MARPSDAVFWRCEVLHVYAMALVAQRRTFNPKLRLFPAEALQDRQAVLSAQFAKARYGGNAEHKRNPGDFGLEPPLGPRPNKTLCDQVGVCSRHEAFVLLRMGVEHGTFSMQERDGWPQNVWAVTSKGEPLEAQHEGDGVYHGYPMPESDPFRDKVLERWNRS